MTRREIRIKTMVVIYQINIFDKLEIEYNLDYLKEENNILNNNFSDELIRGILENKENIINVVNENLIDWTIDRLDNCTRAILEIATFELLYTNTPKKVIINEAIEIVKMYGSDNIKNIVNATLDKIKDINE